MPLGIFGHAAAPDAFVRMVYCLGYGERDLLQGRVQGTGLTGPGWVWTLCVPTEFALELRKREPALEAPEDKGDGEEEQAEE